MARVVVIARENQDYSRTVSDFVENFYRRTGKKIETLNPDKNGTFCEAYDIVEYPSIIALSDDGKILNVWRGKMMPLIDEVNYYMI